MNGGDLQRIIGGILDRISSKREINGSRSNLDGSTSYGSECFLITQDELKIKIGNRGYFLQKEFRRGEAFESEEVIPGMSLFLSDQCFALHHIHWPNPV